MVQGNLRALEEQTEYAQSLGHDPDTLYDQFRSEKDRGDTDDAYEDGTGEYDEGSDDDDDDWGSDDESDEEAGQRFSNAAIELAEKGMMAEALEKFQQAVDANPKSARLLENLGVTEVHATRYHNLRIKNARASCPYFLPMPLRNCI